MKTALLALLLLCGAACAQEVKPEAAAPDLYMEAMRALGEGRADEADLLLQRMITEGPRNPGEWLDLALLQCALGHAKEAETLFQDIETNFDPPPSVADIIRQQRVQGCRSWRNAAQQWSVQVQRGYDTNVNQGASNSELKAGDGTPLELLPEYLPHADHFTTVSADYLREVSARGDLAFLQFHAREHDREEQYDTMSLFAGYERPWRWGKWRMRGVLMGSLLTLGGKLYQEQGQLQLRARAPLPLPEQYDLSLVGSSAWSHYRTLTNFDATTLEVRAVLSYRGSSASAQASAGVQDDEARSNRPGGDREGWNVRLMTHARLGERLEGELDWSRQNWRGAQTYAPGLVDVSRRQSSSTARAALLWPISPGQQLQLELRRVRNKENISIFEYDSRQISLSWRYESR
ncbi:tetratricopeptide repeat protein [Massilia endophytica]|uniref:tetratricopeptide repeat protein n=1 Tax=Massilia endophytica TaxID=2899220 RepID=UPI001E5A263D|nr:tetratricopeptide repeat protein [Massilia endophytica]UGQ45477.1 tetratricopeptide repeat protein [Massilia endophytica]